MDTVCTKTEARESHSRTLLLNESHASVLAVLCGIQVMTSVYPLPWPAEHPREDNVKTLKPNFEYLLHIASSRNTTLRELQSIQCAIIQFASMGHMVMTRYPELKAVERMCWVQQARQDEAIVDAEAQQTEAEHDNDDQQHHTSDDVIEVICRATVENNSEEPNLTEMEIAAYADLGYPTLQANSPSLDEPASEQQNTKSGADPLPSTSSAGPESKLKTTYDPMWSQNVINQPFVSGDGIRCHALCTMLHANMPLAQSMKCYQCNCKIATTCDLEFQSMEIKSPTGLYCCPICRTVDSYTSDELYDLTFMANQSDSVFSTL